MELHHSNLKWNLDLRDRFEINQTTQDDLIRGLQQSQHHVQLPCLNKADVIGLTLIFKDVTRLVHVKDILNSPQNGASFAALLAGLTLCNESVEILEVFWVPLLFFFVFEEVFSSEAVFGDLDGAPR